MRVSMVDGINVVCVIVVSLVCGNVGGHPCRCYICERPTVQPSWESPHEPMQALAYNRKVEILPKVTRRCFVIRLNASNVSPLHHEMTLSS